MIVARTRPIAVVLALRRARDELRDARRHNRELEAALAAALRGREQAERARRVNTAFLRTVGHELRAPLAALREALPYTGKDTPPARMVTASLDWIAELCAVLIGCARSDRDDAGPE